MVKRLMQPTALLLLAGLLGAGPAGALTVDFTPVDDFLADLVADHELPGCALRLVVAGEVVYERCLGYTPDQMVPAASATKWLSAAVVMAAVDRGDLHLDDTTGQWLGWTGDAGAITLRQLMSHTSGIDPDAAPCLDDDTAALGDCVDEIASLPLVGPPGGQFLYGGNSMQVAGRMCEVAAGGRPFVDLFDGDVRSPLGLTRTAYASATNPRVAGGAWISLRDCSRLVEMWLGGGQVDGVRVLSDATAAVALTDQTADAPPQDLPPCVPAYHGYGIGNWIWEVDPSGAPLENASPGAFRLTPWLDRERDLAGTFLTVTTEDICDEIESLKQLVRDVVDGAVTGVPEADDGAVGYRLGPIEHGAGGDCVVEFVLPADEMVRVAVLDLAGRRVATLVDGHVMAGRHRTGWNGRGADGGRASSGVYLVTLEAAGVRLVAKAAVVR